MRPHVDMQTLRKQLGAVKHLDDEAQKIAEVRKCLTTLRRRIEIMQIIDIQRTERAQKRGRGR